MALNRQSTTDLKSTHPVSRSMPPPLSRGDLDQKPMISVFEHLIGGRWTDNGGRLFTLFRPLASDLWPQVLQGRFFAIPLFIIFSEDGGQRTSLYALLTSDPFPLTSGLCQEPGREASERGTALLLSKDGSMLWDEVRRTVLLYSAFNDLLGGRWTDNGERKTSLPLFPS